MRLTLSAAELSVLCAALGADASPFIADSPLAAMARPDMLRAIQEAGVSVAQRGLAIPDERGALRAQPLIQRLLQRALQPARALELMSTGSGAPPRRIRFDLDASGAIRHAVGPEGIHELEPLADQTTLAAEILAAAPLASAEPAPDGAPFMLPHAAFAALAASEQSDTSAFERALRGAKMSDEAAAQLLAAGLRPAQQAVLSALSLSGQRIQARVIVWFSDRASAWLVTNTDAGGSVQIQRASPALVERAVQAMLEVIPKTAAS
jgi:hypothetical protein